MAKAPTKKTTDKTVAIIREKMNEIEAFFDERNIEGETLYMFTNTVGLFLTAERGATSTYYGFAKAMFLSEYADFIYWNGLEFDVYFTRSYLERIGAI